MHLVKQYLVYVSKFI